MWTIRIRWDVGIRVTSLAHLVHAQGFKWPTFRSSVDTVDLDGKYFCLCRTPFPSHSSEIPSSFKLYNLHSIYFWQTAISIKGSLNYSLIGRTANQKKKKIRLSQAGPKTSVHCLGHCSIGKLGPNFVKVNYSVKRNLWPMPQHGWASGEGDQDRPLQNLLLWHTDYSELKAVEKPQRQDLSLKKKQFL